MKNDEIRIDAWEKVTGRAVYTDDLELPGMLYVKEVHCPYPHARIEEIDTSAASRMPGVRLILTAADLPESPAPLEKPVLAGPEVLCAEEAVALVAADTERHAADAAKAVRVTYTQLDSVCSIEEALAPGAVQVHAGGNIACTCILEKGSMDAFAECAYIVEQEFATQRMHHGAVEPDCVVTVPEGDGFVVLAGSKGPFNVQKEVAAFLHMPEEHIRVRHMTIGGGFGGRMVDTVSIAARAGVVTMKTGCPCKLLWTREETLTEGSKRHPFRMTVRLGADAAGTIIAASLTGYADAGAYLSHTKGVVFRAMAESLGPYHIDNCYVNIQGVYTHCVQSDAVRGFGTPQVGFAMERAMDMLAKKAGLSPYQIRMNNIIRDGDIMASGQTAEQVGIEACGKELAARFDLSKPVSRTEGTKAFGWGLAFLMRGESHGALSKGNDLCGIDLDILEDRKIQLSSSVSEVGQGAYTAEAITLAGLLQMPRDCVVVRGADTRFTPRCTTTSGSRGTISGVNGVWLAYLAMIDGLKNAAAKYWRMGPAEVRYRNGRFYKDGGRASLSFWEAADLCAAEGSPLHFEGRWVAPQTNWDWDKHTGSPYYSYSYGTAAAQVEVDLISGRVNIMDLLVINDLGRIINRQEADAQIAGGIMMSAGFALTEETAMDQGIIRSKNLDKYIMQMANDLTHIRPAAAEFVPAANPMGVHGVGELSASIAAPALANAVSNALGVQMTQLPMTLEQVRSAIDKRKGGAG